MSMAGWYLRRFFGLKAELPSRSVRRQPLQPASRPRLPKPPLAPPHDAGCVFRPGDDGSPAMEHERWGYSRGLRPLDRARLDAYWPD